MLKHDRALDPMVGYDRLRKVWYTRVWMNGMWVESTWEMGEAWRAKISESDQPVPNVISA